MKLVHHLLESKGKDIITTTEDVSVFDAIDLMANLKVGSLIVMQDGKMIGIVTERDYARKVILKGRSAKSTLVGEIMSTEIVTATPEQTSPTVRIRRRCRTRQPTRSRPRYRPRRVPAWLRRRRVR